jgi:hypothetical protein
MNRHAPCDNRVSTGSTPLGNAKSAWRLCLCVALSHIISPPHHMQGSHRSAPVAEQHPWHGTCWKEPLTIIVCVRVAASPQQQSEPVHLALIRGLAQQGGLQAPTHSSAQVQYPSYPSRDECQASGLLCQLMIVNMPMPNHHLMHYKYDGKRVAKQPRNSSRPQKSPELHTIIVCTAPKVTSSVPAA